MTHRSEVMEQYVDSDYQIESIENAFSHLEDEKVIDALRVQSTLRASLSSSLRSREFIEISPVIISPLTDPLNHPVSDPRIKCYGQDLWLTKSMIFHKQIAVQSLKKIFIMSPNIRLETPEKSQSGRHLYEFTQADVEALEWDRERSMNLAEEIIIEAVSNVKKEDGNILSSLGREIPDWEKGFRRVTFGDAEKEYGKDFEKGISEDSRDPVWIVDIPLHAREFYDREWDDKPGVLKDMDLLWPEGYHEALSGGEREHDLKRILTRISQKGQDPASFSWFIAAARRGLRGSSGFGIGVERFTRFLCGLDNVSKASAFPKIPGRVSL